MGRKGRPRKSGKRTPCTDRLSRAGRLSSHDYGNIRVIERHGKFQHFINGKGREFEGTSAGRLWIVGAFDGHDIDPQVMRDCLLEYGRRYWGEYPCSAAVANYEQENRHGFNGGDETTPDPRGERFNLLDGILRDCGHEIRAAVHHVTADNHFFPDTDVFWVQRIINSRVLDRRREFTKSGKPVPVELNISGELATERDWPILEMLCQGALALARGTSRQMVRSAA